MKLKNKGGEFTGVNRFDLYLIDGVDQDVIDYLENLPARRRNDALRQLIKACLSGAAVNVVAIPKPAPPAKIAPVRKVEVVASSDVNWNSDFESFGFPTVEVDDLRYEDFQE